MHDVLLFFFLFFPRFNFHDGRLRISRLAAAISHSQLNLIERPRPVENLFLLDPPSFICQRKSFYILFITYLLFSFTNVHES